MLNVGRFLQPLRRVFVLLLANKRKLFAFDYRAIDRDLGNIFSTRHIVHDVEHDSLEHRAQCTRASAFRNRLASQGAQRIFRNGQAHTFHREKLGVLLDHCVLRLGQNRGHLVFGQRVEGTHYRQAADEFGNHSEGKQVFRFNVPDGLFSQRLLHFEGRTSKTHHFLTNAFLDDLIEADKSAAANKEDFLRIDLDVFLVRMFPAALGRNIAGAAFEDFEKCLLNAFARDVARDRDVVGLTPDFVDLVNVNDTDLGTLYIVIRILQQAQNDVLDIFADVASLRQRGGIRDAKRNIENLRQRFGQ